MSLMKLSPETVRLRRIAKAYAAGEFSRLEYRQARREVIDNFTDRRRPADDDDTQPRRQREADRGNVAVPSDVIESRLRLPAWLGALLFIAGLLVVVGAWADPEIPPVSKRDPNPALSPRLLVDNVAVSNFERLRGVDAEELQAHIDAKLAELKSRNAIAEHGFTQAELAEIGRFLNALGVHERGRFPDRGLTDLRALIEDQKSRRGLSIVELEELAAWTQDYYRKAGYLLAVAYLPAQKISNGDVALEVLPGVLGDVKVTGGDAALVRRRFRDLLGEPVMEETLGARLYALNQLPGLVAQASFETGSSVGETQLNLNLVEHQTWSFAAGLDNHGDAQTGQQRVSLAASWLSPRGIGDALRAGVWQSALPWNQSYGYLRYQTPIGGAYELSGSVARNDFTWERGEGLEAEGWVSEFTLRKDLLRSRKRSAAVELGFAHHGLSWDDDVDQRVNLVQAGVQANRIWDGPRIAADGRLQAGWGSIGKDKLVGQDSTFWVVMMEASAWTPVDIPVLPGPQKLSWSLSAQLTRSRLPSTLRQTLGGISGAKAFQRDSFLADSAAVSELALHVPVMLGDLVVFIDSAAGEDQNAFTDRWGHLTSAGVGWDAALGLGLMSRLSWAWPINARGSGGLDDDGPRFYWSLQMAR